MSKKSEDVFVELKDPVEKYKVIEDLVRESAEIKVKGLSPMGFVFLVSPQSLTGHEVVCKVVGTALLDQFDDSLIVQFDHYEYKYIAQVKHHKANDFLVLNFDTALFRVQRREDFRLRLPRSFQGRLILHVDGRKVSCSMIDVSAGGCRAEVKKKVLELKVDQTISGALSTSGRDDLMIEVNVRHVVAHPDKDDHHSVGLKFINQTEIVKNRMAALVMDLYREFFTKRS
ncbi:MAG: PilZ domain-containing protein [Bdellovibrio sp.]|jgi:hypothetical protein